MKNLILLVLVVSFQAVFSQKEERVQDLQKFTEVKVYDGLSVILVRSSENKAIITGDNVYKVNLVNKEGVLKVKMQIDKMFSGYRTFVELHYTEDLNVIDVNEDARITSKSTIKQDVLELKAQEGGELSIRAEVEQLLVKTVTGGLIETSGSSDLQDVAINTGGIYEGKEFKTKFSTVNVNAGSRAEIFASDYVKAIVKAGGEVLVYGDPAKMDQKTVFKGTIKRMQ